MWRWLSSRTVVTGIAVVLFIACCVLPVAYLLTVPLGTGDVSYRALWLDARQQGLLWNTARLGVGTAFLATALGAPLGLALARIDLRGKALLRIVLAAPVVLPPYVVALAWTYLGSSNDPSTRMDLATEARKASVEELYRRVRVKFLRPVLLHRERRHDDGRNAGESEPVFAP